MSILKVNQKRNGWMDKAETPSILGILALFLFLCQQTMCWNQGTEVSVSGVLKLIPWQSPLRRMGSFMKVWSNPHSLLHQVSLQSSSWSLHPCGTV